jgi:hypothetical protein
MRTFTGGLRPTITTEPTVFAYRNSAESTTFPSAPRPRSPRSLREEGFAAATENLALEARRGYPGTTIPLAKGEPMRTKLELLDGLRTMLRDVFVAKSAGETYARLARAHGYVDGYMRALQDTGLVEKNELLELVAAAREHVSGPAIRAVGGAHERDVAAA